MILKFIKSLKIKKRHWYEVKFCYSKNGERIFDWVAQVGVIKQSDLLNSRRELKRGLIPLHKRSDVRSEYLCNGNLTTEILSYIGYFKK